MKATALGWGSVARASRPPLGSLDHALYAGAWAGFLVVLATAALLVPSPAGLGTHTELHLPPCGFYQLFHKPCPSCGMTTAFCWMVRGQVARAFRTQPAGVAVFLAGLALWLYLPAGWIRRRPFAHILEGWLAVGVVWALVAVILGVWIWRLVS